MLDKLVKATAINCLKKMNSEKLIFGNSEFPKILSLDLNNSKHQEIFIKDKIFEFQYIYKDEKLKIYQINSNGNPQSISLEKGDIHDFLLEFKRINNVVKNENLFIKTTFDNNINFMIKIPSKNEMTFNKKLENSDHFDSLLSYFKKIEIYLKNNRNKHEINLYFPFNEYERITLIDNDTTINLDNKKISIDGDDYNPHNRESLFYLKTPSDIMDNLVIEINGIQRNIYFVEKNNNKIKSRSRI